MLRPSLSDEQRIAWLRLARSERIGAVTFHNFINRYGSAQAALDALPDIMNRNKSKAGARICSRNEAEHELEEAARHGISYVAVGEAEYPCLLRETEGNPPFILVQGKTNFDALPHVAIVGSRNASIAGQKMASTLAGELSDAGHVVVSGLARGIDSAAHKASLKTGTVAVIAGGHLRLYPPENISLATSIIDNGGSIVTEMPPNFEPRGKDFPRRNRIISGLSLGVVIVEAARRSGSLITARLAGEQNRQIFAVPGSPLDPRADGTNNLIREGATLIRSAEDIINDLRPMRTFEDSGATDGQEPFRLEAGNDDEFSVDIVPEEVIDIVLNGLSQSPVHQDDIIRITELSAAGVISSLCELEVSGRIERLEGNTFILSP
ncbi:MAG: DNA-processing protein DprA [Hyphomicrobiales bacterium]